MRQSQNSVLRVATLSCLTIAGLALNSAASAACPGASDTGYNNTCFGIDVLELNTTGYNNTGIGSAALFSNTTGSHNTASGSAALIGNTTGNGNTASGFQALFHNTTGNYNTASGAVALRDNTTGYHNTASGVGALPAAGDREYCQTLARLVLEIAPGRRIMPRECWTKPARSRG